MFNRNKDKAEKKANEPKVKENKAKNNRIEKFKHPKVGSKLDMYDMILANLVAGNSIVGTDKELDRSHIDIGFSNITSEKLVIKYFLIKSFPDWVRPGWYSYLRTKCTEPGVRINIYTYGEPYEIKWDSPEMKNKMKIWKQFTSENDSVSAFDYREHRGEMLSKQRIVQSTEYLNHAELDQKRAIVKTYILVELASGRDDDSLINMESSIRKLKRTCKNDEIELLELRVNMIDWLQQLGIFSLRHIKEVYRRISKKILTDDNIAEFFSCKQGRIGDNGVPMGIDISSHLPVFHKFRENPDEAENILIAGGTGSGKSFFIKELLFWMLPEHVVTVLDYEGDEYDNCENYIFNGNSKDAIKISMGKGSAAYFDPMEIGELTGEDEIDQDLKETAIGFIMATFRTILCPNGEPLDKWQESVISTAIRRVYEDRGVTDDPKTWHRSKGLRIHSVYNELNDIVISQEFLDDNMDDVKHRAAVNIIESCKPYFEEGEVKGNTFKNPINIDELRDKRYIVFSFGQKGGSASLTDPVVLALKQLGIANVTTQISNYCRYVRHCFNVKVWEEYQRWGDLKGSGEIIANAMTGGRKRGDINFIVTNDLNSMLDTENEINARLAGNLTGFIIGSIPSSQTRLKFCNSYNLDEMVEPLDLIYKASSKKVGKNNSIDNVYRHSFCMILLNSGEKAIIKKMMSQSLLDSKLFRTGVAN